MGKRSRGKAQLIKVHDAAEVVGELRRYAAGARGLLDKSFTGLVDGWERSHVVLRVDTDFLHELVASSDMNVSTASLLPLRRMPFDSFVVSFDGPFTVPVPGGQMRYRGFAVAGMSFTPTGAPVMLGDAETYTHGRFTFGSLEGAPTVRSLWVCAPESPLGFQSATVDADTSAPEDTLAEFIERQVASTILGAAQAGSDRNFHDKEIEASRVLIPATILLLLYLQVPDGDVEQLVPGSYSHLTTLEKVTVWHVGFRMGATLRRQRSAASTGRQDHADGHGGWTMSPHPRKGHDARYKVVTRDADGNRVGSRDGVEGIDWHYEKRWIHQLIVNERLQAEPGGVVTVRDVPPDVDK